MGNRGRPICHYEHDFWWGDDGRLYLKVTGIEYERSTEEGWWVAGRRRLRRVLELEGDLPESRSTALPWGIEEWDRSHNIADGLVETMTFRTTTPPREATHEAVA